METGKIAKQMIDFQKTTFDNTFSAVVTLQEQAEKMVNVLMEQSVWLPEDGKKAVNEWGAAYKKGRDDFKKSVDENFSKFEGFFTDLAKSQTAPATSPTKSK
jgi:hypothetical protein